MRPSNPWNGWTSPDQRHEQQYGVMALALTPSQRAENAVLRLAKQKEDGSSYEMVFKA